MCRGIRKTIPDPVFHKNPYLSPMVYRASILNVSAGLYLASIFAYSLIYYNSLTAEEGWGMVSMIGLSAIGIFALTVDLILQASLKNRKLVNLIGLLFVLGISILFLVD